MSPLAIDRRHSVGAVHAEGEWALSLVRLLIALVVFAVVVARELAAQRLLGSAGALAASGLVLSSIAVGLAAGQARMLLNGGRAAGAVAPIVQLLDTGIVLGHVVLLDRVVPDVAWTGLALAVFAAGQRFAARGVLLSMATASGGYLAVLSIERLSPNGPPVDSALTAQRLAAIALIGVVVAILAEWLREGWEAQAEDRARIERRFERLRIVERSWRVMRQHHDPDDVLPVALITLLELGFVASTATDEVDVRLIAGDETVLATVGLPPPPTSDRIELTRWLLDDGRALYSASMVEPSSGVTISAWDTEPIEPAAARSVADVVAQISAATEAVSSSPIPPLPSPVVDGTTPWHDNRQRLARALADAGAFDGPVSMLLVDVEDTGASATGDLALRLEEAIGEEGFTIQCGDTDFAVVLTGRAAAVADGFAESLAAHLGEAPPLASGWRAPLVNIGVAIGIGPLDANVVRRTAECALVEATEAGRGTCRSLRCGPPAPADTGSERRLPPPPVDRRLAALSHQ